MNIHRKKCRRKNYLTNKGFQLRYVAMVVILMIILSVAVGIIVYLVTWERLIDEIGPTDAGYRIDKIFTSLNDILFWKVSFVILGGVCIAGLITIFVSHRVAGPVFRANRVAKLISGGIIPAPVELRKKDEVHDLSKSLNEIISKLDEVRLKNTELLDRCRLCLKQVGEGLSSREEVPADYLKEQLDELNRCINEFEVFAREKRIDPLS